MKLQKLALLLLITLNFSCSSENEEPIIEEPSNDITLSSQEEIDNFNLTTVKGILKINEKEEGNITNLNGLKNLTSLGSLFIFGNKSLTSLEGLENLQVITGIIDLNLDSTPFGSGGLVISLNPSLLSLEGLDNLRTIGSKNIKGWVQIWGNKSLVSLNDLKLTYFQSLDVLDNESLKSIENITSITEIDDIIIRDNMNLKSLNLNTINTITGYLEIVKTNISTLEKLNNLTDIGKDLDVAGNNSLSSLQGFENLNKIGGKLNIGRYSTDGENFKNLGNNQLTNLCDIKQLIANGQITNNEYFIVNNAYNPTIGEIQNSGSGGCEQ